MTQVTTGQNAPPGSARDSIWTFPKDTDRTTVYKTVGVVPYPGSLKSGVPAAIVVVAGVENASAMDVRIYDVKNDQAIAEKTGITAAFPSEVDLGAIANVSQDRSLWELQYRRSGGSGNQTVSCSSATLEY
jgi:hypothetical protein